MVEEKKENLEPEETDEVTAADNEEILVNIETLLIREYFDGTENVDEVFDRLDELELALEDLFEVYDLTGPIEDGCAHFKRKNWINRDAPGWKEAVEAWNESNDQQIKL